jgi:hypothetical protein
MGRKPKKVALAKPNQPQKPKSDISLTLNVQEERVSITSQLEALLNMGWKISPLVIEALSPESADENVAESTLVFVRVNKLTRLNTARPMKEVGERAMEKSLGGCSSSAVFAALQHHQESILTALETEDIISFFMKPIAWSDHNYIVCITKVKGVPHIMFTTGHPDVKPYFQTLMVFALTG